MPLYNQQPTLAKQLDDALARIKALELRGGGRSGGGTSTGPSTPGVDTTPPVVTVQPIVVSGRSATITVVANEPVSGILNYGVNPGELTETRASSGGLVQTLTFVLTDLAPSTVYYSTLKTTDLSGNSTSTALATFTTGDGDGTTGGDIVAGPNTSAQSTTATVSFTTATTMVSRLDYRPQGTTAAFTTVYELTGASTTHLLTLSGLTAGTTYQANLYVATDTSGLTSALPTSYLFTTQTVDSNGVSISRVSAVPAATGGVNVSSTLQAQTPISMRSLQISIRNANNNASSDSVYGSYDTAKLSGVSITTTTPLQITGFKLLGPGSYVAFVAYQLTSDPTGTWYTSPSTPFTLTVTPTDTTPGTGTVAKTPPTVSFSTSTSGLTATFRANATDADSQVVAYDWDFGDVNGSRTSAPSHTYTQGGTYTVSVTAIDNDGYAAQATQQVTVNDADPIGSIPNLTRPAIFYSPHSDDQILSLGVGIIEHIAGGRNVIVVLMTEGASTYMQNVVNGNASGPFGYSHSPTLEYYQDQPSGGGVSLSAIALSRRNEFLSCVGRFSVMAGPGRVYAATMKYPEGLTVATAKSVIQRFESRFPGASHKTMSYNDSHADHAACGQALQQLASAGTVSDARYYVKYEDEQNANITSLSPFYSYPADATQTQIFRDACRPHLAWNPAAGAYAFGYQSVNTTFDALMASPRSFQHR